MCGEKWSGLLRSMFSSGSPPHVRGKVAKWFSEFRFIGITPACAGKRNRNLGRMWNAGDHPRMCGEKLAFIDTHLIDLGSPPHVRGKDLLGAIAYNRRGITPACAGKSFRPVHFTLAGWDHPRMCGEKLCRIRCRKESAGSPPHVRGKAVHFVRHADGRGITPACAGKRGKERRRKRMDRDHPRMCGEKLDTPCKLCRVLGSPPHVRGKELYTPFWVQSHGITPACAGKRG